MINGTNLQLRSIITGLVALATSCGAIYLLGQGIAVPAEYWAITSIAVVGVVGKQLIDTVADVKNKHT